MELTREMIGAFQNYLYEQEKSKATIEKYIRDLNKFYRFLADEMSVTKEKMICFKKELWKSIRLAA